MSETYRYEILKSFDFRYILNTSVDFPHNQHVNTLKFRPHCDPNPVMAVSTSSDGKFKLWALIDDTDIYSKINTYTVIL